MYVGLVFALVLFIFCLLTFIMTSFRLFKLEMHLTYHFKNQIEVGIFCLCLLINIHRLILRSSFNLSCVDVFSSYRINLLFGVIK